MTGWRWGVVVFSSFDLTTDEIPGRFVDMKSTTLISIAVILGWFLLVHYALKARSPHGCNAPCEVKFPSGTQEDDFKIDWHDGKLYVTKLPKGHD